MLGEAAHAPEFLRRSILTAPACSRSGKREEVGKSDKSRDADQVVSLSGVGGGKKEKKNEIVVLVLDWFYFPSVRVAAPGLANARSPPRDSCREERNAFLDTWGRVAAYPTLSLPKTSRRRLPRTRIQNR
ncbi:uncharacterized protein RHO17_014525 [Thomomys bottae]